jgi:hypothetical protein
VREKESAEKRRFALRKKNWEQSGRIPKIVLQGGPDQSKTKNLGYPERRLS